MVWLGLVLSWFAFGYRLVSVWFPFGFYIRVKILLNKVIKEARLSKLKIVPPFTILV